MGERIIGWLNRDGIFFECEQYEHITEAYKHQDTFSLKPIYKDGMVLTGEGLLEELGWVLITQSQYYCRFENYPDRGFIGYISKIPFSKKQVDWFKENRSRLSPKQREQFDDLSSFLILSKRTSY